MHVGNIVCRLIEQLCQHSMLTKTEYLPQANTVRPTAKTRLMTLHSHVTIDHCNIIMPKVTMLDVAIV